MYLRRKSDYEILLDRLYPKNPQLAKLLVNMGPRSFQEYVIDYWNQNERLPDDFGSMLVSGPAVNAAWRRAAA
jgi:hypothetical protein